MKNVDKNIIAACILAFGLILSTIIYAYSSRNEIIIILDGGVYKVDRWNGTYEKLKQDK